MLNTENIQSLIDSGEGYNVEFKVRVPSKVRELTEEICAFANADGGYLLIGVDDNGQVVDTNLENDKRSAIQGSISEISPALHCELYSINIGDKTIWVIDVPSGKDKNTGRMQQILHGGSIRAGMEFEQIDGVNRDESL